MQMPLSSSVASFRQKVTTGNAMFEIASTSQSACERKSRTREQIKQKCRQQAENKRRVVQCQLSQIAVFHQTRPMTIVTRKLESRPGSGRAVVAMRNSLESEVLFHCATALAESAL